MNRRRSRDAGFSLIEVLVAVAITAVVTVTVTGAVSTMAASFGRAGEDTQLALLMQALAGDLRARGIPTTRSASFDIQPDYSWSLEVKRFVHGPLETEDATLAECLMTVRAPSGRTLKASMLLAVQGGIE